jgi:succinate-semialdehyde dehydrogenase/glutarate-semialdehyde dehydrogenase
MELGGSDPCVILKDADLDLAVQKAAKSRLINSGQSCIAAKRFIVEDSIYDEFRKRFINELQSYTVGDPNLDSTQVGPLARADLKDELHRQVTETVNMGGTLLFGGHNDMDACFYPITLLENVSPESPAYREEFFGPVATLIRAQNEQDAVRIANDTNFGLGASIFSRDVKKAERLAANELEAGCCFVNDFVRSDPRLPFGGIKESGFGRELSMLGIKEFVNAKTVYVA